MASAFRAGTAVIDVTPDELAGLNAMGADFETVHDRLLARALVLESGGVRLAIVSVDQLEVGTTVELRARIEQATGIPASHVLIAPSHSHNAPRSGETPVGGLSRAPSTASLERTPATFAGIADAVAAAQGRLAPARLATGAGRVDVNVNRNVLRDHRWVLGADPAGPSDKTVTVLAVDSLDGTPVATAFAYAVHPTVSLGIRAVSADLAGAACRAVEAERGGVALWLAGAIGDQAPHESFATLAGDGGDPTADEVFAAVERQGAAVASEGGRGVGELDDWEADPVLTSIERQVCVGSHRGSELPPDMPQHDGAEACVRLIAVRIGDLALAGVGGEVTVPAAEVLSAASPAPRTAVVSIANERMGYLADPRAFELGQFAARGCPVQPEWLAASADAFEGMFAEAGFGR